MNEAEQWALAREIAKRDAEIAALKKLCAKLKKMIPRICGTCKHHIFSEGWHCVVNGEEIDLDNSYCSDYQLPEMEADK